MDVKVTFRDTFMTLLQQRDQARRQRRLEVRDTTRRQLRAALTELLPGQQVILFGSITQPGAFHDRSDVDLALTSPPPSLDTWQLTAELSDRLQRPVDLVDLNQCRFREKILRQGEVWTL